MLKCHLDDKAGTADITVKGNLITVLTDLTYLVCEIYQTLRKSDPITGDIFKTMLRECVDSDSSPMWKVSGTHKAGKDGVKGVSVHIPGELRNLLDTLREDEHGE